MNTVPDSKELTDILEHLDLHIGCDIGHPGGFNHTMIPPCEREADFSLNFHACEGIKKMLGPAVGFGSGTWCAYHLSIYTANTLRQINLCASFGHLFECLACPHIYRGIPDAVWNVNPIR